MVSGPEILDGASLLQHDVVAKESVSAGEQEPNLSGFIDILRQFKDAIQIPYAVVEIDSQPFMDDFFYQFLTEAFQKKNKDCLDNLMMECSAASKKVKAALQSLQPNTLDDSSRESSATLLENKIKTNMQGALTRRFVELMTRYQAAQAEHKALARDRLIRVRGLANPRASKEEIEAMIDAGPDAVFTDRPLTPSDHAALSAYQDVASKHEELVRLESSIRELHQLFVDIAIMFETQGEMLDDIEENVSTTVEYTEEGIFYERKAVVSANQARKKACMLALCLAFVLALILAWFSSVIPRF